jgi:hypothetical protein
MSQTSFSQTYTSNTTITIPSNAAGVVVTVAGAKGGYGGADAEIQGGPPGAGRIGTFTLANFTARNLQFNIGTVGGNGVSSQSRAGPGGGGSGVASGGTGGYAGPSGSSGGGAGGGGATGVYDSVANAWIIVAGGSGGGGGASHPGSSLTGGTGQDVQGWAAGVTNISNGGTGGTQNGDGGGGGGGGGGAPGGGGGNQGYDNSGPTSQGGYGGGSRYNSSYATLTNDALNSNSPNGYVTVSYTLYTPQINSFSASPNPQTSGSSGIPASTTTLSWTSTDSNTASINQGVGSVNTSGSVGVNTGLQSVAGSNSPATINYTLTACAGSVCTTSSLTVSVYNDNSPNAVNAASTTTSGTSLSNLNPGTQYQVILGPVSGIDMTTQVSSSTSGVDFSTDGASWANPIYITNGQTVYARFYSLNFNTDPSGLTNSRTINYTVGTYSSSFVATTRAPNVNEKFDFGNSTTNYPYPDIDQITNTPSQYMTSPTTLLVGDAVGPAGDAEISVEIKVSDPKAEIRITPAGSSVPGAWQTPRST